MMNVPADGDPAIRAFRQPYIGRLILDFGLLNPGATTASYELSAQAQTTGAVDAAACESATNVLRELDAVLDRDSEPIATLRTLNQLHAITLPERPTGGFGGELDLRIRGSGTYRIYQDSTDAQIAVTSDGVALPAAEATAEHTTCEPLASSTSYVLAEGTYELAIDATASVVRLLIEETCASTRTVPATCPGAAGDLFVRDTMTLPPGGFISGRINSLDLGVGDQAVVALRCLEPEACEGALELFFLVQQLECRTDNDCRAREACSSDAYCVDVGDTGCASVGRRHAPPSAGPLCLLALAVSATRRRWRR